MAGFSIGVSSNFILPGSFVLVALGQGPSTATAGDRSAIYVMPKASDGYWTVNTVYQVKNEQDAIDGAGAGSPLHRVCKTHLAVSKRGKFYAVAYNPSSGAGVATASGSVTFTGTALKSGTFKVTICGEELEGGFQKDDTASDCASITAALINERNHLPVTASALSGVVTLTARIAGASQNSQHRYRAEMVTGGSGLSVSTGGATLSGGSDGATTEAANQLSALNVLTGSRYYYMGTSLSTSTGLTQLNSHIDAKADPLVGLRSVGITAQVGALSSAASSAVALNKERMQLVCQANSEHDIPELVGQMVALRQMKETERASYNFDGFRDSAQWKIKRVFADSDIPDSEDLNDALTDGVTPIGSDPLGSYLVMSVTTRSKNNAGTVDDRRALETHRLSVCDLFADTLLVRHQITYQGFQLKDDERLRDGSVNPNQVIPLNTLTPSTYKPFVRVIFREFERDGLLKNVDTSVAALDVDIDPNNGGRLRSIINLDVINLLHQSTFRIAEVSAG